MRPRDTSIDAQRVLDEHYRRMTPAEKIQAMESARRFARAAGLAGLRLQHPDAREDDLEALLDARWLGEDLYAKVVAARDGRA